MATMLGTGPRRVDRPDVHFVYFLLAWDYWSGNVPLILQNRRHCRRRALGVESRVRPRRGHGTSARTTKIKQVVLLINIKRVYSSNVESRMTRRYNNKVTVDNHQKRTVLRHTVEDLQPLMSQCRAEGGGTLRRSSVLNISPLNIAGNS